MSKHIVTVKAYLAVFLSLLGLTALTTTMAYVNLGSFNTVVALAIAAAKALLVLLFFMHVWYSGGLVRIVVAAGLLWLAILVAFSLADLLSRHWSPIPSGWLG